MAYIGSRPDNVISRNAQNEYNYTATGGQTTFTGADSNNNTLSYTPGNIEVYFNGARLEESDFTATNGTSIVLANAAVVNDELSIVAVNVFEVADVVPASTGGTFQGGIAVQGGVNVAGHILPDTNITYDLGSTTQRFRDLYLSGNSIQLGTRTISQDNVPDVNLAIAPEVLTIDVAAPAAGQDTQWLWNWLTSSLPYARRAITNSNELNVPLYKQGTYTVNNFAKTQYGSMTQAHTMHFKWIDGAGTQNNISWVTDQGTFTDSHPDINGGADTTVQRLSISVPSTITPPTLTAPSVTYTVTNSGSGSYTFSGPRDGNNPNIGPLRRGGTYTFNINATGHPFYLTTDNGTNFSAGTYFGEYTSGVTGSRTDSGTLTFVVPANAPDTLYYQCGNHSSMRGAITVKDLAVETNINGNYVVYAQHTQEGHKTPVELRPIPSLVNQMCLVYDSSVNKFVPQDLATYVENTPSFENKIREVAGTAELVVEDGSAVVAKVNVYADSTYLPLTDNNAGDQAFATDTDKLYIWDGSAWQLAGAANTGELPEGTNLYYTDARVASYLSSNDFDTATNIVASITDSAPSTLDTLNELAAALGDDANFSTTVTNSIATKLPLAGGTMTGDIDMSSHQLVFNNNSQAIQIRDAGGTASYVFYQDNADTLVVGNGTTVEKIRLDTSGNEGALVIDTDGNVGIGDNNPAEKFTIKGDGARMTISSNDYEVAMLGRRGSTAPNWDRGYLRMKYDGTNTIVLDTGGVSYLNGGNVGIGTSSPSAVFHVSRSTYSSTERTMKINNGGNNNGAQYDTLLINQPDVPSVRLVETATNQELTLSVGNENSNSAVIGSTGQLVFSVGRSASTLAYSAGGRAMTINSSANVGIGTASPDNNQHGSIDPKLHVYGSENTGFNLVARFQSGTDQNDSGAAILINHGNDRGILIEAGRDGRDYPNPPYFNGTGNPANSSATISNDDGVAHLGILNSGGSNTRMITLRQHSWIGDNKYNVGINQQYPVTKLEISDYKDGTGNNPNGIGLRLSSTSSATGSNSANGGTGIEFAGHGHNYNGAGTGVGGSNPIAIRINPIYEYWGQNNSMSNYGQTYPYLKFDFKKSDNVNYITPLLVSSLGNGRVAIGNDTASVSHRLSLGSDAKPINYRVTGSGGHAIADGTYEENARSFSLGGSDTAFITEGTVSNSNKWRVKFEGDFGNNYQGGGLNFPAAQIYVTNTQPTVYIGSTNITVSRDSGTGKLKVTNQSNSYAVHFTGKITVWDHPQSNRPTFDSEMQAISLQGTDDYGTNLYGGLIMKTPAYSEYHFQWAGQQNHSLTFTCGSYQMSTMEYTSHQTNGGSDIHKYIFGKWANNHTTHTWNQMENNGSTWGLTTTFTATDQSGGSSNPDGKLVINETYGSGSVSTRTLVVKTYYGGWNLTFA